MATHMKTTVDIAGDLLLRAKELAQKEQITLRQLIEEGLREMLERASRNQTKPVVKTVVFSGKGLQPEFKDAGWDTVRDAIYPTMETKASK